MDYATDNRQVVGSVTDEEYRDFLRTMKVAKGARRDHTEMWEYRYSMKLVNAMQVVWWDKVRRRIGQFYGTKSDRLVFDPMTREVLIGDDELAMKIAIESAESVWEEVESV